MLKLLSIICICLYLGIYAVCQVYAQPFSVNTDQVQADETVKTDNTGGQSINPIATTSPQNTGDYTDKTNAAADLCREAKQFSNNHQQEEARSTLEKAVLLDPNGNSGVVHNQLGLALCRLGNPAAALPEFNLALSFTPENTSATLNIAECYKQLGQLDQAKIYLKRFIDENPNLPQVSEAKATLNALRHTKKITGDKEASDYLESVSQKGLIGWPQSKMPIRIFIEDGHNVFGYQDSFRNLVQKSMWQWSQASERRLTWRAVWNKSDADIVFHWTSDKTDFPNGAEQGIAKVSWRGHCIEHAEVTLCTVPVGSVEIKPLPENEMEQTCLHEIGHALGLAGHSSNNNDVMFFCVRPYPVTQLTDRDKNAIARLYSNDFIDSGHSKGGGLTVGIPGLFGIRF